MGLKLMYITNRPEIAQIAELNGVERIFVDMEYIGKAERQFGLDTVQSHHTIEDIRAVRSVIHKAQLMVRVNPIHNATEMYDSSKDEINAAIEAGADILMLPFFKTVEEAKLFVKLVAGRAKTMLLVETPEAVAAIDEILQITGIDEVFIGLNDLSLGYKRMFMFELLADGTVERLCNKFAHSGIPYGFGGIASIGKGMLPSEYVIKEHYRLGSSCVILSRSFCDIRKISQIEQIEEVFKKGIEDIRRYEQECTEYDIESEYFSENKKIVASKVKLICDGLKKKRGL